MLEVGKDQKNLTHNFDLQNVVQLSSLAALLGLTSNLFSLPCFSFIIYLASLARVFLLLCLVKVHVKHLQYNKLHNCILSLDVSIKPSQKEPEVRGNRIIGLHFSTPRH